MILWAVRTVGDTVFDSANSYDDSGRNSRDDTFQPADNGIHMQGSPVRDLLEKLC